MNLRATQAISELLFATVSKQVLAQNLSWSDQNEFDLHEKMNLREELIFIRMVLHEELFLNRGKS